MSLLSYPERGPWGQSQWAGNCSGYVYRELFLHLNPQVFVDPMVGSGTSIEVAREMNIEAYGLDLHSGFNILQDSILERVGKPADLCISHPPYHTMHQYSRKVWGKVPHPADLSECSTVEEFLHKMQLALLNQREATRSGGHYGCIIGDMRRGGQYHSFQADLIGMMPRELAGVLIKAQHHCRSDHKTYLGMRLPAIEHEYILIWERRGVVMLAALKDIGEKLKGRASGTWKNIVKLALMELGGTASLQALYDQVSRGAPTRIQLNPHWKAKVRQTLQQLPDVQRLEAGSWGFTTS